ncbi:hypothetical protein RINTHM_4570 [Richelia intracellularis HM01]|nr:hypothetical protein RINTHM_4570 [Richelia intracellularis HM01]
MWIVETHMDDVFQLIRLMQQYISRQFPGSIQVEFAKV